MIDSDTSRSAGWWLARLLPKLQDRKAHYGKMWAYFTNDVEIPVPASKAVRDSYRRLMRIARTNYAETIVEATRERMIPVGFRTGADGDQLGDAIAQRIWQTNHLDADSAEVHRYSLSMGMGYVIVGPGVDGETTPVITPEDPREVIAEMDPRQKRRTLAAIKVFDDDIDGSEVAYVYLPGQVWRAKRALSKTGGSRSYTSLRGWDWDGDPEETGIESVPVVPFPNRSRVFPTAEFETHLPLLDRLNYQVLSRLEIATMQAFRQRAMKGVPSHDQNGVEINYDDIFEADPGALWLLPATAEMWESGQVDLGPIRQAARDDVHELVFVTSTPLYRLSPDAANGSAEGASLQREALIAKVNDRILQAGEAWEQVMSHAFAFQRDSVRSTLVDIETIWRRPEYLSLAERHDANIKARDDVPWRFRMSEILGYTPVEIERMERERAGEAQPVPTVDRAVPARG